MKIKETLKKMTRSVVGQIFLIFIILFIVWFVAEIFFGTIVDNLFHDIFSQAFMNS